MTDDTTTIEITEDQRDELKALKAHDRESYKSVIGRLLESTDAEMEAAADVDPDDLARRVAERLEGSKPLEDMAFEDWFEPDYAETIAAHINAEIATGNVTLEASERRKIAQEVAEVLQG